MIHQASMANTIKAWAWQCQECQRECVPIRAESRCMCGHRLKEHTEGRCCSNRSCSCPKFSFIVAEGAWVLRCRCKHKHTEHDPTSHACRKAACSCSGFSSPWVCNCDHPWSQHQQVLVEKQVLRLGDIIAQAHQISGSSIAGQPELNDTATADAAAAAEAAPAAAGGATSLQGKNISSTLPAASAGVGAAGSAGDSHGVAVKSGAAGGSSQDGRLSSSGSRLQQLEQQRRMQQQVHDAVVGPSAEHEGPAATTGNATATAVTAPGVKGHELLLAQGDFACEVNRWDLVQRGACNRQ